jgi:long-chain acyl-CoA synthetase
MSERYLETLPGLVVVNARVRPHRVAVRKKALGIWHQTTWAGFLVEMREIALALHTLGVGSGGRAAIIADNDPEWLYCDLGIQSVGAYSVGIYPTQIAAEVAYIIEHSCCNVAFCGDQEQVDKVLEHVDEFPRLGRIVCFDMKGVSEYRHPLIESFDAFRERGRRLHEEQPELFDSILARCDPDDIALVGYTSGTTGKPKGALVRHRNQVSMARHMSAWAKLNENDRDFSHFPLCHPAVRVVDAYCMMMTGGSINFPESPDSFGIDIQEISPTLILGTPRFFERFKADIDIRMQRAFWLKRAVYSWATKTLNGVLERRLARTSKPWDPVLRILAHWLCARWMLDQMGLLRLRYGSCGGASTAPELLKFFWALGVPVFETYGQTETSGFAFSQRDYHDIGTAGVALPSVEYRISESGELQLRGDGVFVGYLDDPAKTVAAFDGDWYRTGDIARVGDDSRLVVLDREKHVIQHKRAGQLSPSEIENKLKLSPYISDAMVIGGDRPFLGALVEIDHITVADWAARRNLPYTTFRSLTENPAVLDLIEAQVREANVYLPEDRQVRGFRLLPRELDPDLDEVTPTRKIKRNMVTENFAELIEDLFAAQAVGA